jgi:hypothetical protein
MSLIDGVYADAIRSLRSCCDPRGLKASGRRHGHHQIWARDSMIAALGGSLLNDAQISGALRTSVDILKSHHSASGAIPNNVDAVTGKPNFRAYADAGLWWIVGSNLIARDLETCRAVLAWYECQDVDQSGLLSMQESTDWQDLFCTRGKGLYLNCLYVLALESSARLAVSCGDSAFAQRCRERASAARAGINDFHWYRGDGDMRHHIAHTFSTESKKDQDSLGRKRYLPKKRLLLHDQYYLPYLGFRAVGEWFDSLGHLLALIARVPNDTQTARIFEMIDRNDVARFPMRSLFPVVAFGDPDWRDYYGLLNTPHHYHNGGVWPFIGGFYVAVLVGAGRLEQAVEVLERLAQLNRTGEFNEWHHGATGEPMGVHAQAWSAAMYIYACECVRRSQLIHFEA